MARPPPVGERACAGLADFILLPSTALALGPRAFVVELGRGTGSLAGNLSRGTLMSFASFWYGQSLCALGAPRAPPLTAIVTLDGGVGAGRQPRRGPESGPALHGPRVRRGAAASPRPEAGRPAGGPESGRGVAERPHAQRTVRSGAAANGGTPPPPRAPRGTEPTGGAADLIDCTARTPTICARRRRP